MRNEGHMSHVQLVSAKKVTQLKSSWSSYDVYIFFSISECGSPVGPATTTIGHCFVLSILVSSFTSNLCGLFWC